MDIPQPQGQEKQEGIVNNKKTTLKSLLKWGSCVSQKPSFLSKRRQQAQGDPPIDRLKRLILSANQVVALAQM